MQGIQRQRGIPRERVIDRHRVIDISRVKRRVDDGLARGHGHAVAGRREAAANAEDDVGLGEEVMNRFRDGPAAGAKSERMILREGALPL